MDECSEQEHFALQFCLRAQSERTCSSGLSVTCGWNEDCALCLPQKADCLLEQLLYKGSACPEPPQDSELCVGCQDWTTKWECIGICSSNCFWNSTVSSVGHFCEFANPLPAKPDAVTVLFYLTVSLAGVAVVITCFKQFRARLEAVRAQKKQKEVLKAKEAEADKRRRNSGRSGQQHEQSRTGSISLAGASGTSTSTLTSTATETSTLPSMATESSTLTSTLMSSNVTALTEKTSSSSETDETSSSSSNESSETD